MGNTWQATWTELQHELHHVPFIQPKHLVLPQEAAAESSMELLRYDEAVAAQQVKPCHEAGQLSTQKTTREAPSSELPPAADPSPKALDVESGSRLEYSHHLHCFEVRLESCLAGCSLAAPACTTS